MTGSMVEASGLVRRFGDTVALDGVDVRVGAGEIFGFVGPDGAGKTTLFRVLTTLLLPDSGKARVLGLDVVSELWKLRRRIGYMPGRFSLYPDLTVEENLRFFATAFGTTVDAQYEIIAPIYRQIEPFRHRAAADLSGGMKQKLALSCALVHRPDILFLDEPTTGVDAVSRREFWDLLVGLRDGGLTVVVSTPYMDEARRCDRVALMQRGRILATDAPASLVATYPKPLLAISGPRRYQMLPFLRGLPHVHAAYPFGETLHYVDSREDVHPGEAAAALERALHDGGFGAARVRPVSADVEDLFMYLMGPATEAA